MTTVRVYLLSAKGNRDIDEELKGQNELTKGMKRLLLNHLVLSLPHCQTFPAGLEFTQSASLLL